MVMFVRASLRDQTETTVLKGWQVELIIRNLLNDMLGKILLDDLLINAQRVITLVGQYVPRSICTMRFREEVP